MVEFPVAPHFSQISLLGGPALSVTIHLGYQGVDFEFQIFPIMPRKQMLATFYIRAISE